MVHNGYKHRYSNIDSCNYQLIDTHTHNVQSTWWNNTCNIGYNACASIRDNQNFSTNEFRYECVETFRDSSYDFSFPTYDYDVDSQTQTDYTYQECMEDYNDSAYCSDLQV